MIKVKIVKNDKQILQITVSGHADSDVYGKDLVCAAVSTVCTGIANTLDNRGFLDLHYGDLKLDEGYMKIDVFQYREDIQIVLETMVCMLYTIQQSNTNYIKIMEEN